MKFKEKFSSFWHNPRNLFIVGLLLTLMIVLMEFLHDGMENHIVYRDATINFFNGVSSYTPEFAESHSRYFLYLPVFHFLYAPFAFLPVALGGLLWNLFCYCLFFVCIMNLPRLSEHKRSSVFLLMLPFLGQSLFCFQFNTIVCCIFLLAYILLERGEGFWAVLLIALSASIKVYGVIQLALLLCYPKFWRNLGYAILCLIGLMLVPATKLGFEGLIPWYMNWADCLMNHSEATGPYFSLIWAWPLHGFAMNHLRLFQMSVLAVLAVLFFVCHKRWQEPDFRVGALATLVIYIIIMSEATEYCTYIIPASVIMLWFVGRENTLFDKILVWGFFILFGLVPIDLFCPSVVARFIHTELWLGVWLFAVLWGRIIYSTCVAKWGRFSLRFLRSENRPHFAMVCSPKLGQFLRFCIIGTLAAGVHYGIYYGLQYLGVDLNISYITGYVVSFVGNYIATNYFTFRTLPSWKNFIGFAGSHAINFALHIVLFNLFIYIGVHRLIAPVLVMLVAMLVQFTILRFVFQSPDSSLKKIFRKIHCQFRK